MMDSNNISKLDKQEIEQKIQELITMEFIESLFPTDEEIEELIEKYFKENK